jgi:phage head maturation protease
VQKIREGVIKSIYVGYIIHSSVRTEGEKGQPDTVLVNDWEPIEVSAVSIPADPGAQIRKDRKNAKPLSRRERRSRNGAAEATRLLQSTRSRAEAKGAAEAQKLLGHASRSSFRVETPTPAVLDANAVKRGARVARKLLRVAK